MNHRTLIASSLAVLCLALLTGCGAKGQSLTFASNDGTRVFEHSFPESYVSKGTEGDLDIFLVEDGLSLAEQASSARKPLAAAPDTPRQIVHLRIVWTPMKGTRPDHPAATNAVIHWYVLGVSGANEGASMLHYTGSGFVKVNLTRKRAVVEVSNVQIALKERRGDMADPLGPTTLSGEFKAKVSETNVKALLAEVRGVMNYSSDGQSGSASIGQP